MATTANSMPDEVKVLGDLILTQLAIRRSDLEAKLDRDIDLKGIKMPPKSVVSTGVKRFANPQLKRPFDKLAKQAERICREAGFALLSGWAIPMERAHKVHDELEKIKALYLKEADDLQAGWVQHCEEWERLPEHVELQDMLRRARPDAADIRRRYRFGHVMYRVQSPTDDASDPINSGVKCQGGGVLDALLEDLAVNAERILKKSFTGKDQVQRRVIQPVAGLADKLRSFSMVDPLVYPTALLISEVIVSLPTDGKLSKTETSAIRGLLELLTQPEKVRAHGYSVLTKPESSTDDDADSEELSEMSIAPVPAAVIEKSTPVKVSRPTPAAPTVAPPSPAVHASVPRPAKPKAETKPRQALVL